MGFTVSFYHEPKNIDIAKFIGQGALINGFQDGDIVTTALGKLTLKNNFMSTRKLSEKQVKVLIRPDDIIHDDESDMSATVVKKIFRGADFLYTLKLPTEEEVLSFVPSHHDHPLHQPIGIRLEVDHVVTFDSTEPVLLLTNTIKNKPLGPIVNVKCFPEHLPNNVISTFLAISTPI